MEIHIINAGGWSFIFILSMDFLKAVSIPLQQHSRNIILTKKSGGSLSPAFLSKVIVRGEAIQWMEH